MKTSSENGSFVGDFFVSYVRVRKIFSISGPSGEGSYSPRGGF